MRRHFALAATAGLMALVAPLTANAFVAWDDKENVQWQGPGYYVFDAVLDFEAVDALDDADARKVLSLTWMAAGPFATQADCEAAISAHAEAKHRSYYECDYEATKKASDL